MPLPVPHALGTVPDYGNISTVRDNGKTHSTDSETIPGDYVSQLAADMIAVYGGALFAPKIVVKVADYTIQASDARNRFTGAVNFILPPAVALPGSGIAFEVGFILAPGGRATAGAGDVIQYDSLVGNAGGYVVNNTSATVAFWMTNIGLNQWLVDRPSGSPLTISE